MFVATGPYFHPGKPWRGGPKLRRWGHVAPPGLRKIFLNDAINMALLWSFVSAGAKKQPLFIRAICLDIPSLDTFSGLG
jgi:hypothetical protein